MSDLELIRAYQKGGSLRDVAKMARMSHEGVRKRLRAAEGFLGVQIVDRKKTGFVPMATEDLDKFAA